MPQTANATLWLPFTQMRGFDAAARTFVGGEGAYLYDAGGARVFDAVSSIWTTIHGHCHPDIVRAIAQQAAVLDHSTLLGASNPRAEQLAARLSALVGLPHVFFASDGASAIEAALKMALQYWQHSGQTKRTRFVHLRGSYHGDTAAAMSVSDIALFKSRYGALTFETGTYGDPQVLTADDVAAVIVEPVVQAASGMHVVPPDAYAAFADMSPLLIVDEIATGFGRTGTMFAFDQLAVRPDIVCLGKGISGGTLALSATIASERIYEAFLGEPSAMKQFFHGHSYAGNPIACAAAVANLEVFENERTLERAALVTHELQPHLQALAQHPRVREVRGAGLMYGIEIDGDAPQVAQALYARGFFTRPIGQTVQFVPPLCLTVEEGVGFLRALAEILSDTPGPLDASRSFDTSR